MRKPGFFFSAFVGLMMLIGGIVVILLSLNAMVFVGCITGWDTHCVASSIDWKGYLLGVVSTVITAWLVTEMLAALGNAIRGRNE